MFHMKQCFRQSRGVAMFIIIVGGGKLGRYLCKELIKKEHSLVLVEQDQEIAELIKQKYKIEVVVGDGSRKETLEKAGVEEADLLLAVTRDDQDNMVICQLAERQFNVARTLTTVNTPGNEKLFNWLGVNVAISSASVLTALVDQEDAVKELRDYLFQDQDSMEFVRLNVTESSPVVGKKVKEIEMPLESVLVTILRGEKPILPRGNTVIKTGDLVMALTRHDLKEDLREIFQVIE